jgi:sulfate transport system permease protein
VASGRAWRSALRGVALVYLTFLIAVPVAIVVKRTFAHGFAPVWAALQTPGARHALLVTLQVAGVAVVLNTIFGVGVALLLVRHEFPGKRILNVLIDLPLAVSPVVVGLSLILVYGRLTPVGRWLGGHGIDVIFALPGMVLATVFITLPLVVREVVPVLEEVGEEQEQAAWTLGAGPAQTFRRVTLPSIRWALAYGVVLALARAIGEFGAVAVVSGNVLGKTQTMTLFVEERFQSFDRTAAYAAALTLAAIAIVALVVMSLLRPKEEVSS